MRLLKTLKRISHTAYCSRGWQIVSRGGIKDKAGKKLIRSELWLDAEKYYERLAARYPKKFFSRRGLRSSSKSWESLPRQKQFLLNWRQNIPEFRDFRFIWRQFSSRGEKPAGLLKCLNGRLNMLLIRGGC